MVFKNDQHMALAFFNEDAIYYFFPRHVGPIKNIVLPFNFYHADIMVVPCLLVKLPLTCMYTISLFQVRMFSAQRAAFYALCRFVGRQYSNRIWFLPAV